LWQRRLDNTKICYYTSTGQNDLTNAIFLLGAFMVIHLDAHPEQAFIYIYIYIYVCIYTYMYVSRE
jgi:hypothetical protein